MFKKTNIPSRKIREGTHKPRNSNTLSKNQLLKNYDTQINALKFPILLEDDLILTNKLAGLILISGQSWWVADPPYELTEFEQFLFL